MKQSSSSLTRHCTSVLVRPREESSKSRDIKLSTLWKFCSNMEDNVSAMGTIENTSFFGLLYPSPHTTLPRARQPGRASSERGKMVSAYVGAKGGGTNRHSQLAGAGYVYLCRSVGRSLPNTLPMICELGKVSTKRRDRLLSARQQRKKVETVTVRRGPEGACL